MLAFLLAVFVECEESIPQPLVGHMRVVDPEPLLASFVELSGLTIVFDS